MVFSRQSFGSRDDNSKCCINNGTNIFSTNTHYQKDEIKYGKDIWGIFLIIAFVLGICGILLCYFPIIGIIVSTLSIIFSILGFKSLFKKSIIYFIIS